MRWIIKSQPEKEKVDALATRLRNQKNIAYLLVQKGIETYEQAKEFFRPRLEDLHDPFLMKDMDLAVARIEKAIEQEENILVYGDYDVDGTTSVALMATYLSKLTDRVATYIPDRYKEGYGISYQGIDYASNNDFSLIIALDCGIKAVDKVAYANEKDIDFIICDHHLPGDKIPPAKAILNPKRPDCSYPFKELCGCGVGFKLIQAINQTKQEPFAMLLPYLDLVATAIGADIVPIIGENRILAHHGLHVINTGPRPGFRAIMELIKESKKEPREEPQQEEKQELKKQSEKEFDLTITNVVFTIAPRINAAGRMEHALSAVDLLMEEDLEKAKKFAQKIEEFNNDRRITDKGITAEALLQIEQSGEKDRYTTVVYHEKWHKGVIGIVASRLIETYYRPTLVFTKSGDKLSASARSVQGFNVYEALEACAEHIEQFGGHKYAAGLTMEEANYEAFKQKFEEVVSSRISRRSLNREMLIDMKLNLTDINPRFYRVLKQFAPFGPGNMRPVFLSDNLTDTGEARQVGQDEKHLKCCVTYQNLKYGIDAIGFNLGDKFELLQNGQTFEAVYSLDENEWNNKTKLQLKLKDIRYQFK